MFFCENAKKRTILFAPPAGTMVMDIVEGQRRGGLPKWPKFIVGESIEKRRGPNMHCVTKRCMSGLRGDQGIWRPFWPGNSQKWQGKILRCPVSPHSVWNELSPAACALGIGPESVLGTVLRLSTCACSDWWTSGKPSDGDVVVCCALNSSNLLSDESMF